MADSQRSHTPRDPTRQGPRVVDAVPLLTDVPKIYFTPVTVMQDGAAWVGEAVTVLNPPAVHQAKLIQRVDWQLLTLDWPDGATSVQVFISPQGEPLRGHDREPVLTLSRKEHQDLGGIRMRAGTLPAQGCDVHLVAVSYHNGRQYSGRPLPLRYRGLLRLDYRIVPCGIRRSSRRRLEVRSDAVVRSRLRLVIVSGPDRLPLSLAHGRELADAATPLLQRGEWLRVLDFDLPESGWVRMFVDLPDPPADIAVLDPPIDTLRR
jgi:hypothetical protein